MWWPNRISSGRLGRFNFYMRWWFVTPAWSRIWILGPVKDFCRPMLFPHSRIYTPWSCENTVLWRNSNKNSCRIFLFFLQYCWIFYARPAYRTLLISTQWFMVQYSLMLQPATAFIYCHSSGANTLRVGGLCWIYAVKFSYSWRSGRF